MQVADFLPNIPASVAAALLAQLRAALPRPVPDTPQNREIRDRAAFAAVKALNPTDVAGAMLATMIVAMEAGAQDSFRMADEMQDFAGAMRMRKLGDRMMREAQRSRNFLRQCQARRPRPPEPALPGPGNRGNEERAVRPPALDLRLIETPPTIH